MIVTLRCSPAEVSLEGRRPLACRNAPNGNAVPVHPSRLAPKRGEHLTMTVQATEQVETNERI
jgi:hypothetical protein